MIKCPKCKSKKISQHTPITDHRNKTKYLHAICQECKTELRIDLDGSVQEEIKHDQSWLDDLSKVIED